MSIKRITEKETALYQYNGILNSSNQEQKNTYTYIINEFHTTLCVEKKPEFF